MKNERLVEFTPAILTHLAICGYKVLKIQNKQQFSVIEPVKDVDSIEEMSGNNAFTIPIFDQKALDLTKRVLSLNIKFYIDVHFIE